VQVNCVVGYPQCSKKWPNGICAALHCYGLERVMNCAGKPHRNANVSVSSVLRRPPVFRISKPFLSKFITASSVSQGTGRGPSSVMALPSAIAQSRLYEEV
jgi:hypothetical protein